MAKSRPTNSDSSSSSNALLVAAVVAGTAAAGALLVYALTRRPAKTRKAVESTSTDIKKTVESERALTKNELVRVLQDITGGVQQVIMRLAQEEQRIVQSPEASRITPEQMQHFLLTRFQEGVTEVENLSYEKFNTSEDAVKAASTKFASDPDVSRTVSQLRTVYSSVMGGDQSELPPVPDFLTKQKTLEILIATMKILRDKAELVSKNLQEQGLDRKNKPDEFMSSFQLEYGREVEDARKQLYSNQGIEEDMMIQAAVVKYQNDAEFQRVLKQSSESHNQKMAEMGFFPAAPGGM